MTAKTAITLALALLLLSLQWPLWFGKGSLREARKWQGELSSQEQTNTEKRERNTRMASDVKDLNGGVVAAESQARLELGMIRGDEVFVQITPATKRPTASSSNPANPASSAKPASAR